LEVELKAADFAYAQPQTLEDALSLLSCDDKEVRAIAGGQSLMPMMNFRLAAPEVLVDLNKLDEISFVRDAGGAIEIGAMTRFAELEASELIAAELPLIAMALPYIAHPAIRNRGTIGGSVALADPAAEMPAILLALDAHIHAISQAGGREIAAADFFRGPYDTALCASEIVQMISFPKSGPSSKYGFYELARRHGDYAMAGAAVALSNAEPVKNSRIALFGAFDRALRATSAEAAIDGRSLSDAAALQNAIRKLDELDFVGDLNAGIDTKRHLAKVTLRRALEGIRS
jgi:carbon-monoxide dehydrogenase medium subunit